MCFSEVSLKGDAHATRLYPRGQAAGWPGPAQSANSANPDGAARGAAGKQEGVRHAGGDAMRVQDADHGNNTQTGRGDVRQSTLLLSRVGEAAVFSRRIPSAYTVKGWWHETATQRIGFDAGVDLAADGWWG